MLICPCSFHSLLFDGQKHSDKNCYLTFKWTKIAASFIWRFKWRLALNWRCIFRSTLLNWPNKVGLNCPFVCLYVHLSTKSFFDFNEIWHVCIGRWVMHDNTAVCLDPRSRSRAFQSWKSGHFQKLSPPPFKMGAGNWLLIPKLGTISKFD